ncbi:efflux RND transporter periplasmic adaptor subunit [Nitratireductor rhodophyticola]|uniref:efflux RND transporter periplasmic adaptor subunit n=1 Tax=Nitratireductor rhodophyticola TaxID=2854036 RepID=UPI0030085AEC
MPHRAAVRESDVKPLRLLFAAAVLAAAAGAAFWYYGRPEAVSVAHPEQGSAAEIVFASGVVEPRNWAKVTSLVRERIIEVCNCEGARVAKGDVLARLDASEAEATLTELRARQKLAVDERDRLTLLVERNVTSVTALERARAEVSQVEALIAGQTARLENYELRAPGDGLILRQDAEVGEIAEPGNVLFWVGRPHPRIVIAEVNEEDIPRVVAGQRVLIRSDAFPRSELEATVDSITPKGDPVTRTYRVRLTLPEDTPLMIGMSVDANIVTRVVEDALLVPALVLDGDTLFIVEDDVARRRTVETGIRGTERIEILSGIDAGAQIISPYPDGLEDGARVSVESR